MNQSPVQVLGAAQEKAQRRVKLAESQWLIGRPDLIARVLDPAVSDAEAERIVSCAAAGVKGTDV